MGRTRHKEQSWPRPRTLKVEDEQRKKNKRDLLSEAEDLEGEDPWDFFQWGERLPHDLGDDDGEPDDEG